jgi:hypothetical protein
MAYVTPVTNRTAASYWNVSDWTRVYRNCQLASALSEIETGTPIDFDLVSETPTASTIPAVDNFNILLANLERMRLAVASESISGAQTEIKDDWLEGVSNPVFGYSDCNLWESTIDAIWDHWDGDSLDECPTLTATLTITTGNYEVYVDCLADDGFDIITESGADLYII